MLEPKVIEERNSKINGKIQVVKSLAFGKYIQVEGLTQSGGVVYEVWESVLKRLKKKKLNFKNVLILGLGGGSAAKLVRKFWKDAKITGVDIDPLMVELGEKYLGLKDIKVITKINDALEFVLKEKGKYDLILVDTYQGDEYPKKFESEKYLESIKKVLENGGICVFNRLYWDEKRTLAHKFLKKLENIFDEVLPYYPEANVMFICKKE